MGRKTLHIPIGWFLTESGTPLHLQRRGEPRLGEKRSPLLAAGHAAREP